MGGGSNYLIGYEVAKFLRADRLHNLLLKVFYITRLVGC